MGDKEQREDGLIVVGFRRLRHLLDPLHRAGKHSSTFLNYGGHLLVATRSGTQQVFSGHSAPVFGVGADEFRV